MELRQLELFVAVARRLHFGQAALDSHVSQPAVSQQIKRLERNLGVRLFERHSRQVMLTAAGFALLPEAEAILASADHAVETARAAGMVGV
jgi:DNA-binding transcriptional LysR family regulator